jgi:catechol 2,3-dioxygenase-like lactoylglutathione lyase family enzyme
MMQVKEILEVCLYVHDLDAAQAFYQDVLGLELLSRVEGRHAFFHCGARVLLLFNAAETCKGEGVPVHGTSGDGHICFAIHADELPAWEAHLQSHGVEIEQRVTWSDRGDSIYFRDPDGNSLELASPRIWRIPEERTLQHD